MPTVNSPPARAASTQAPQAADRVGVPRRAAGVPGRRPDHDDARRLCVHRPEPVLDYAIYDTNETDAGPPSLDRSDSRTSPRPAARSTVRHRSVGPAAERLRRLQRARHQLVRDLDRPGRHPQERPLRGALDRGGAAEPRVRRPEQPLARAPARSSSSRSGRCPASTTTSLSTAQRLPGLSADCKEWQSASNWRNKFVFPVSFRPFPDVCELDHADPGPDAGLGDAQPGDALLAAEVLHEQGPVQAGLHPGQRSIARHNLDYKIAGQWASNLAFTTRACRPSGADRSSTRRSP